ncbi:SDR family NAD(P)-dependent oxidoreductase [Enterobacteriaceae bacterium ESL0689]|nr:SDR family NAD(P)-dependent oxidoreductase [Enterobacteriaceae bacterium ESL0689]
MSGSSNVIVITGASQGIGAGLVQAFLAKGDNVVANSRNISGKETEQLITVSGDIAQREIAQKVIATAINKFGRVDTLINNAGIFIPGAFTEYTEQDLKRALHVNIEGFFHVSQFAISEMLKRQHGHVVQITASLVKQALAKVPSVLAGLTKGGLDAATRQLAIEYAGQGIRINAVAPGIIKTPMHTPESIDALRSLQPTGETGDIADIVEAVLYLDRAGYITGETLYVDGGAQAGCW